MSGTATLDWHDAGAWALIVTNAVAGAWALAAQRWRRLRGSPLVVAIVLAQLTTVFQAITGTLLIAARRPRAAAPPRALRVHRRDRRRHPLQLPHQPVHARPGALAVRARLPVHHGTGAARARARVAVTRRRRR